MSSFVVSPEDIQYLMTSAITLGVMAGNNTPPTYRWHSETGGGACKLTPQNATFLGNKLWLWNVISVLDDYPGGNPPGYSKPWQFEFDPDADYVFDPLQIIKSIAHFQYQCHKNDPWGMGFLHALQQDALSIAIAQRSDLVWGSPSRAVSEESIANIKEAMAVPAAESETEGYICKVCDQTLPEDADTQYVSGSRLAQLGVAVPADMAVDGVFYRCHSKCIQQLEAEEERNAEDGLRGVSVLFEGEKPGDEAVFAFLYRCNECETTTVTAIEGTVPETPVEPASSIQCPNCRVGLSLFEKRLTAEEYAEWGDEDPDDEEPDDDGEDAC